MYVRMIYSNAESDRNIVNLKINIMINLVHFKSPLHYIIYY